MKTLWRLLLIVLVILAIILVCVWGLLFIPGYVLFGTRYIELWEEGEGIFEYIQNKIDA